MNNKSITPDDILEYWFSEKSKQYWFASTPEIDNEIREKYEAVSYTHLTLPTKA